MSGRALGVMDSQGACKYITHNYIATVVTQSLFIAEFPCRLTAIRGRPRVAGNDAGAVTFTWYKCPSGTAAISGTLLHSGTYDLKGTADTNQVMTLVPDADSRTFQAGDGLSVVLSGTATLAVGSVTFTFDPIS